MRILSPLALAAAALMSAAPTASDAQTTTPYLGQVMAVPFSFCPKGWLETRGQLLPIAQYQALFALYGTTYGGDGISTFGLPSPVQPVTEGFRQKDTSYFIQCVAMQGIFPSRN